MAGAQALAVDACGDSVTHMSADRMFDDSLAPPTRFDINFRVGDIPVRVHPFFWLTTLFLGLDTGRSGIDVLIYLVVWAALGFVSILVHELGHVLMGRRFGSRGHIILTGFCGLAVGSSDLRERGQRNAVYVAGPGAGFLLAALVLGVFWLVNPGFTPFLVGSLVHVDVALAPGVEIPSPLLFFIVYNLLWINIFWGLVNLLPIWPLDGGQVCRELCQARRGRDGVRISLQISVVTAGVMAALALLEMVNKKPLIPWLSFGGSLFPVLFFALLAVSGWQILQLVRRSAYDWEEREQEPRAPWEQDADWWKRGGKPWDD
jgi:stage IV sporulation protein FB